ncbi:hypothetical protein K474DRAFT_1660004 [Panus rudis PR-1116 ss-1]|nr:hypothetical protein K474DRAFT_1660004 [Panus rudis PR-1116 ss-1]
MHAIRWRLILLSPEEEEEIAAQLAGPGWYAAVGNILAQEGPVNIISPDDWRYKWVENTLRRLERAIPILQREKDLEPKWLECGPDDIPIPPPAEYPLRPRPRASEYIRRFAELSCARTVSPAPHSIAGPPYSLILVDKPESSNAFSYGFGPDGGGGVVVFSGFLDEILSKHQEMSVENYPTQPPQSNSWWSSLFGAVFPSNPKPLQPTQCIPTEEQTSELAILLAHELSHLVLAHHLETLSSGSIIYPGVISIFTDVARALLFPVTMLFGPFLNDALASMGKVGSGEFSQIAEYCTSQAQEIEADIVSARLLAHAGFDPRHAVKFWEDRKETEQTAECSPAAAAKARYDDDHAGKVMRWMGSDTHPINVQRVAKLKEELERWERVRQQMREKLRAEQSRDSH